MAPVNDVAGALDSDFSWNMLGDVGHPTPGPMRVLANPVKMDGTRLPSTFAPALGVDNHTLLEEQGYDGSGILRFRESRTI